MTKRQYNAWRMVYQDAIVNTCNCGKMDSASAKDHSAGCWVWLSRREYGIARDALADYEAKVRVTDGIKLRREQAEVEPCQICGEPKPAGQSCPCWDNHGQ